MAVHPAMQLNQSLLNHPHAAAAGLLPMSFLDQSTRPMFIPVCTCINCFEMIHIKLPQSCERMLYTLDREM